MNLYGALWSRVFKFEDARNQAKGRKICPPHKRKDPSKPTQKVSASRKKLVNSPSGLFSKKKKASKGSCQKGTKAVGECVS